MNKEFATSLDITVKILTLVFLTVMLSTIGFTLWRFSNSGISGPSSFGHIVVLVLLIAILAYAWAFRVIGYTLDRESLRIRRPMGYRRILLKDIAQVIVPPVKTMRWSLRTFGNGGIFGFTGYYANTTFGSMQWFATRTNNYIIIQLKDGEKIVITPDDTGMASAIREQAGLPAV